MRVIVIGAGAAGLVAAAEAAHRGASVVLLEKNSKTGVKILMSGGTRCNLTQDTDARGIVSAFGRSGRFLQKSVGMFPPTAVVRMFSELGVPTKIESTGKIFPQSDRALHVRDALQRQAEQSGVAIRLRSGVRDLRREGDGWCVDTHDGPLTGDRVIVTAGGKSWPGCGTTGDGYGWLQRVGHTIVSPRPALVPLVGGYSWTRELSGVTLDDCVATVRPRAAAAKTGKPLIRRRSSLLLTHFGFSGPAAMDVSGLITAADSLSNVQLVVDLLPEVPADQIRQQLTDRSASGGRSQVAAVLSKWLPNRLAAALAAQSGCDCTLAQLPRASAMKLIEMVKSLELPVTGTRGFEKAEVTAGGVACSEVDPRTMASRVADNLYVAGEVLDVDGWIGGYNFQAAFSTGRAAGIAAAGG
jgi:predicted Rossmann fold flavoprotein